MCDAPETSETEELSQEWTELTAALDAIAGTVPGEPSMGARLVAARAVEVARSLADHLDRRELAATRDDLAQLLVLTGLAARLAGRSGQFDLRAVLKVARAALPELRQDLVGRTVPPGRTGVERPSALDGVPAGLPTLSRAEAIQRRASAVGFDWKKPEDVLPKLGEEVQELLDASRSGAGLDEELGDVLFTLVNVARHFGHSLDDALRKSVAKFEERFRRMEAKLRGRGLSFVELDVEELERLWGEVKKTGGPA